jgi:hypothetical protein
VVTNVYNEIASDEAAARLGIHAACGRGIEIPARRRG